MCVFSKARCAYKDFLILLTSRQKVTKMRPVRHNHSVQNLSIDNTKSPGAILEVVAKCFEENLD